MNEYPKRFEQTVRRTISGGAKISEGEAHTTSTVNVASSGVSRAAVNGNARQEKRTSYQQQHHKGVSYVTNGSAVCFQGVQPAVGRAVHVVGNSSRQGTRKQVVNHENGTAPNPIPPREGEEFELDASCHSKMINDIHRCWSPPFATVPPMRFAMVEDNLYRGGYPTLRNFPCLQTLGLRCILSLTPEKPTYDLEKFAEAENISLHHIAVERFKGEVLLSPTDISTALHIILDGQNYPLYVHCLDGRHVVGMLVLVLRRLRGWDPAASRAEYLRFAGEIQDDLSAVNDFTGPITVTDTLPTWLRGEGDISRRKAVGGIKLKVHSVVPSSTGAGIDGSHTESREYQFKSSLRHSHSSSLENPLSYRSQGQQQQLISTPITPITPFGATFASVMGNMQNTSSTPTSSGGVHTERQIGEMKDTDQNSNFEIRGLKGISVGRGTQQVIRSPTTQGTSTEHNNYFMGQVMSMRMASSGSGRHQRPDDQSAAMSSKYVVVDPLGMAAPRLEEVAEARGDLRSPTLFGSDETMPFALTSQTPRILTAPKDARMDTENIAMNQSLTQQSEGVVFHPLTVGSASLWSSTSPSRANGKHAKRRQSF